MAADSAKQERNAALFMSIVSIGIATMEWFGRPGPGDISEAEPDWYVTLTALIHGGILLLLLFALARLGKMTADAPGMRMPLLILILVAIPAAAYVVGRDLGMV